MYPAPIQEVGNIMFDTHGGKYNGKFFIGIISERRLLYDLGPIVSKLKRDVNGLPLNPVMREYPRNYIRTGISAIDGLTTLIGG